MVEISTENENGIHCITVQGDIDASSSIYLDNAIKTALENEERKIIANLTGLDYISSAGLGVFISYIDEFELRNINMALFGINDSVRQVFDILGLGKLLTIEETKEAAINALND